MSQKQDQTLANWTGIINLNQRGDLGSKFSNDEFLNTKVECYWFKHNVQYTVL